MEKLYDIIPEEDKECIKAWINSYANCYPDNINKVLEKWSDNKKTLYKALGKKLRVSFPIQIKKDEKVFYQELTKIYRPIPSDLNLDYPDYYRNIVIDDNHQFILDLYVFFQKMYIKAKVDYYHTEVIDVNRFYGIKNNIYNFSKLLSYSCIQNNEYKGANLVFTRPDNKTKTIKDGARAIRAIQGVLKFFNYDKMENFNAWRNSISDLNNARNINCNLVFSIHPIDFMTMSDNTCNWRSCMSWMNSGCYSAGTIEMMNSNNTIVTYLESPKPFEWNGYTIPNKTWRCLIYVHKDILCTGKSYPYYNKNLNFEVLKIAQNLLKENLHWKYQYQFQKYKDLRGCYGNRYVRKDVEAHRQGNHKIFLYTYGMYNDLIEDHTSDYWCCRNWVKDSLKISVSGRATCMNCGEYLDDDIDDPAYANSSRKYCASCEEYRCYTCGKIDVTQKHYKIPFYNHYCSPVSMHDNKKIVCGSCLKKEIFYDEANEIFFHINDVTAYTIRAREEPRLFQTPKIVPASKMIGSDKIVQC